MKVASVGSALVDVFVHSSSFTVEEDNVSTLTCTAQGGKLPLDHLQIKTGGGGTNTAVGFKRLGFDATVVAELGSDDLAELVVKDLRRELVTIDQLVLEKKEQTGGAVIFVCQDGSRMVLVHRGAATQLEPRDIDTAVLGQANWAHLSSLSGQLATIEHVINCVAKHDQGMSWNPGSDDLELLAGDQLDLEVIPCQVLILNLQEWSSISSHHSRLRAVVPEIVVTDGRRGGIVYARGHQPLAYQAKSVQSSDDTGAGDAFGVGYIGAKLHGKSLLERIQWGVENAAAVVQQVGAKPGLLRRVQLERLV
ncbi:MAG: hypothetical protein COU69_03820 [Candidatus Pacebacteria bacterium CG10_big_fil_rev_8_21_14_0_10_56_10]|nr:MAG: hypothetical protein COU69_03820 [Candidatus Pacebacteria bacterium CG10_big_fil_rev_8_21_14_0_10_56_10]